MVATMDKFVGRFPVDHGLEDVFREILVRGKRHCETVTGQTADLAFTTLRPDEAARIIDVCQDYNRKFRMNHVRELAQLMKSGAWLFRDPLVFLESGWPLNGHHRAMACMMAGVEIPVLIQIVPESDAEKHLKSVDRVAVRTLSDYFKYMSVEQPSRVARLIELQKCSTYNRDGDPTHASPREPWENYYEVLMELGYQNVLDAMACVPNSMPAYFSMNRGLFDWFALQLIGRHADTVRTFLMRVRTPDGLPTNSPPFLLHDRLRRMKEAERDRRYKRSTREQLGLLIVAWNTYYERRVFEKPQKLRLRANESFPSIMGAY